MESLADEFTNILAEYAVDQEGLDIESPTNDERVKKLSISAQTQRKSSGRTLLIPKRIIWRPLSRNSTRCSRV